MKDTDVEASHLVYRNLSIAYGNIEYQFTQYKGDNKEENSNNLLITYYLIQPQSKLQTAMEHEKIPK
jgi:hypothetical protein